MASNANFNAIANALIEHRGISKGGTQTQDGNADLRREKAQ